MTTYIPKEKIGVGCADIGPQEKKYVSEVLESERLSYGPFSIRFEKEFATIHESKYALFCNSGTSALQVALACLKEHENWQDGDEVIVPGVTFIATSNIVIQNNMKPVFVDAHPKTYNIDPNYIESKITPRTRAIIVAHLFGLPCDMDPILNIANKHKLKVIEDSCETMFVNYKGKKVGSIGDISCFSTYIAHFIVTGVGGLTLTNNPEYAVTMRSLMNHGRDSIYLSIDDDKTSDSKKLANVVQGRFRFVRVGYSYRCTEMEAAIGLAQVERWKSILSTRQNIAAKLISKLKQFENDIQLPTIPEGHEHAFMLFPIVIKNSTIKKEDLVFFLENNKIETRDMMPLLNQPIYVKLFGELEKEYPVARHINQNGFYIGCHQRMTDQDIEYISHIIGKYLNSIN